MADYDSFIDGKRHIACDGGFSARGLPSSLFDFQASLVEWACSRARAAIFADCGMGKTPMQLAWADQVVRHTGGRVLILTPLAVAAQTVAEGEKFGVECARSAAGELPSRIVVTNYQRLHHFRPEDFAGVVCDESSILKSFDGATKDAVTRFMRGVRYRLLATATAAPNDFIELGTSSEALGHLGATDMLGRFFRNKNNNIAVGGQARNGGTGPSWSFRGHAEGPFWRWVATWARALRKPSDLGFPDGRFALPPLNERRHVVSARAVREGWLFAVPARGLAEEREERRRTLQERCEKAAALLAHDRPGVAWCALNDEGDLLSRLIPGAVQVSGADSDEEKEEKFTAFSAGQIRVLVTKPAIGAWGLNWQHCAHMTTFASHSYEQTYQCIRRAWRFGQTQPVTVDYVLSDGEGAVVDNLRRKQEQADRMFAALVANMNEASGIKTRTGDTAVEVPAWL